MADGPDLVSSPWGPGLIGSFSITTFMINRTNTHLGLMLSTLRSYSPEDGELVDLILHGTIKVTATLVMDTVHLYGCVQLYWQLLIVCRRKSSSECQTHLPLNHFNISIEALAHSERKNAIWVEMKLRVGEDQGLTSLSSFYVQRVWIISGNHKLITILVLIAYSAVASTICDAIITGSVVYFLRAGRPKVKLRRAKFMQQLTRVTINMGLLTCVMSLITVILHAFQGDNYWVEISGVILSRSYVNSMLAVLNARKSIRDGERDSHDRTIEIPSIQMI
ncbi:hypothetical protein BS17DRAFT_856649 [Gyrodon lividus]|nr:hypothetical protein BS17DRAFT_856649 [Gyrodon lividus]